MHNLSINGFSEIKSHPIVQKKQQNYATFQEHKKIDDTTKKIALTLSGLAVLGLTTFALKKGLGNKTVSLEEMQKAFDKYNIKIEKSADGKTFVMDKLDYEAPDYGTLQKYQKTLNKYLDKVTTIKGDANFYALNIHPFKTLKEIGGNANFACSFIKDLGSIEKIGGDTIFQESQFKNLGNLKTIGGSAWFNDSKITNITGLKEIGGNAWFVRSEITNLGSIERIGKDAVFGVGNYYSLVNDLGNLKEIGKNAWFVNSRIKDLKKLKIIGGNAYIDNSEMTEDMLRKIHVSGTIL